VGLRQAIIKKGTIGESGQGIVQRQLREWGREDPLFSDVALGNDEIHGLSSASRAGDFDTSATITRPSLCR
jgi:hypothetical protein